MNGSFFSKDKYMNGVGFRNSGSHTRTTINPPPPPHTHTHTPNRASDTQCYSSSLKGQLSWLYFLTRLIPSEKKSDSQRNEFPRKANSLPLFKYLSSDSSGSLAVPNVNLQRKKFCMHVCNTKQYSGYLTSGPTPLRQCRFNVYSTYWRWINVELTWFQRYVPAG